MKVCLKCNVEKELKYFEHQRNICHNCKYLEKKKRNKTYEISVKEKECFTCEKILGAENYYPNKKHSTGLMHQCKECQKEKVKSQYKKRSDKIKKKVKEYQKENRHKIRLRKRAYHKKKFETDPRYRLTRRLRCRLKDALRKKFWKKNTHFAQYIGCDLDFLKAHIENQFKNGMSWELLNEGKIHLDHITPLNSAETEQELYTLCHYTNIQPLWAEDNLSKSDKLL